MTSCAVQFCNNKLSKTENVSYFRFPTDPLRCKQWIESCQTFHLFEKDPAILQRNFRVCSVHFEEKMFLNPRIRNRLTINAVPTLFSDKILLARVRSKENEFNEFETQAATASCSSPITVQSPHSSYNLDVSTSHIDNIIDEDFESASISNVSKVSISDSSYQTPLHLTSPPRKLKFLNEVQSKYREIKFKYNGILTS